jgi:glucose uptake protein
MILPQTYIAALLLMLLSMLCWGSWANTYKMTRAWRFELFYFDYSFGVLLAGLLYALTAGSLGFDGFSFTDDLMHASKHAIAYGFGAGVIFNLANMLLVAAIAVAGLAVAFPISIGLALIIGVIWNYAIKPQGNPVLLFSGCSIIVAAIVLDALAYRGLALIKLERSARQGKAKSTRLQVSLKGIVLSLVSGVLMGSFYPLVEQGKRGDAGLGPYAIGFVFVTGVFLSTFVFNLFFMNLPVEGPPVEILDYFSGKAGWHLLGIAGGAIWCTGTIANFVAASAPADIQVGPAISYAIGQGATMVSALWGILVWKEFTGADTKVKALVAAMLGMFVCGLALVSIAPIFAAGR